MSKFNFVYVLQDKEWDSLCIAYITQHLFHGIGHLNVVLMKFEDLPEFQQSKFPFKPNSIDNILPAGPHLVAVESTLGKSLNIYISMTFSMSSTCA